MKPGGTVGVDLPEPGLAVKPGGTVGVDFLEGSCSDRKGVGGTETSAVARSRYRCGQSSMGGSSSKQT